MTPDDRLRREAERREAEWGEAQGPAVVDDSDGLSSDPAGTAEQRALVHELRVHQIELEMQNDELRRTQLVLERTRAEFEDLYDEAPVGYASLDAQAVITRANRTLAAQFGSGTDTLIGKPFSAFLTPESEDAFLRRFRALFREPAGKSLDVVVSSRDAVRRILHITARRSDANHGADSAQNDAPAAVTLRIATTDVTDRRRAETRVNELLAQKELLFRELRHRTSNNYQLVLAMLSLQSDLLEDERVSEAFSQAMSRIESMLVVHESLVESEVDARTEIGTYLPRLIDRIVSALDPDRRVKVTTRIAQGYASADTASSIGLIVNELATNAWKHAFAGRESGAFEVTLARGRHDWVLAVCDDGAHDGSADIPSAPAPGHGLGQTLVEALAGQLGATYARETGPDGTRCILRLPLDAIEG